MGEVLRLEGLKKSFGSLEVLKGIDLSVAHGETVVIIGSSGCVEISIAQADAAAVLQLRRGLRVEIREHGNRTSG